MRGNIDFEEARVAATSLAFDIDESEYRGMPHIAAFAEKCGSGNGKLICDDEPFSMTPSEVLRKEPKNNVSINTKHSGFAAQIADKNRSVCLDSCEGREILRKTSQKYIEDAKGDACNAYITLLDLLADKTVCELSDRLLSGEQLPLAGVPISVKDNICIAGERTSCASAALKDYISPYSATVYSRLIAAGAFPVGKTNMDEFAVGSDGGSSYFGACLNPLDFRRTPGGSSSGSAASVAAGSAVISLGSDTGGSARIPAIYCGLCAFKPSYGALSRHGLVGMAPSLEQICPMARCIDDLYLTFELCAGEDGYDMTCAQYSEYTPNFGGRRKKVAVFIPNDATHCAVRAVERAVSVMREAGYDVHYTDALPCFDDILGIYYTLSSAEATSQLARYDGVRYGTSHGENAVSTRTHTLGTALRERLVEGAYALTHHGGEIYIEALRLREQVRRAFDVLLADFELLLTPASDTEATLFDKPKNDADRYAVYANLTGQPAVVMPCVIGENGLPVGIQLTARYGADRFLLSEARELEELIKFPKNAEEMRKIEKL